MVSKSLFMQYTLEANFSKVVKGQPSVVSALRTKNCPPRCEAEVKSISKSPFLSPVTDDFSQSSWYMSTAEPYLTQAYPRFSF